MLNVDATLVIVSIASATAGAAMALHLASLKAKRRAFDLRTANKAMRTYYTLMEEIVDDPALPLEAAEFLAFFSEVLPDKTGCAHITSSVAHSRRNPAKGNGSREKAKNMFDTIEELGEHRPDLRDKFHRAVASGIVAIFHRWPGNSWKFSQVMQEIASDPRKEFQLVYRFARDRDMTNTQNHHALA
ncbi:hypothetical protein [Ochrobactrum sp. CGA5]|uniref:hypothetical protein n=1 Tax=Ochrobactrum sp. CGA5 TaxID=2583453 RepID=UPI00111D8DE4|nr:hypothetical protein [Ochrobactrum sp. CGA5]